MPIDRRRRIFRSGTLAPARHTSSLRPTLLVGVIGAGLVAGMVLLSGPRALFGRVPADDGGVRAEAQQVAVVDGATLRLADYVVRLRGVTAPARGQPCRRTDGQGFDCAAAAAEALAGLVRDRTVACRLRGRDEAGFPQAVCEAGGAELNRAVVATGWARADGDIPELQEAESTARAAGRGLWGMGAAPRF